MANSTLDSDFIVLECHLPGFDLPLGSEPLDGILGASHHNVAAPIYRLGDRMCIYNVGTTGLPGWSKFSYVKFELTGAPTPAAKQGMVPDANTSSLVLTNDPDSCIMLSMGVGAVCISVPTDAYYGWVWSDGVCPEDELTSAVIGGNFATDTFVVIGPMSYLDLTDVDAIGFGKAVTLKGSCGYSLSDDA